MFIFLIRNSHGLCDPYLILCYPKHCSQCIPSSTKFLMGNWTNPFKPEIYEPWIISSYLWIFDQVSGKWLLRKTIIILSIEKFHGHWLCMGESVNFHLLHALYGQTVKLFINVWSGLNENESKWSGCFKKILRNHHYHKWVAPVSELFIFGSGSKC